jgi:hypothetical protein
MIAAQNAGAASMGAPQSADYMPAVPWQQDPEEASFAPMDISGMLAKAQRGTAPTGFYSQDPNEHIGALQKFVGSGVAIPGASQNAGISALTDMFKQRGDMLFPQMPSYLQEARALNVPIPEAADLWRRKQAGTVTEDKFIPLADYKHYSMPDGSELPAGMRQSDVARLGLKYKAETKPPSGEIAGRLALLESAADKVSMVESLVLDENGQVKPGIMGAFTAYKLDPFASKLASNLMNKMAGNEDAQTAYTAINQGTQAILRTETGAAMPQIEVANVMSRYLPDVTDNPTQASFKIKTYFEILKRMAARLDPNSALNHGRELTKQQIADEAFLELVAADAQKQAELAKLNQQRQQGQNSPGTNAGQMFNQNMQAIGGGGGVPSPDVWLQQRRGQKQ